MVILATEHLPLLMVPLRYNLRMAGLCVHIGVEEHGWKTPQQRNYACLLPPDHPDY